MVDMNEPLGIYSRDYILNPRGNSPVAQLHRMALQYLACKLRMLATASECTAARSYRAEAERIDLWMTQECLHADAIATMVEGMADLSGPTLLPPEVTLYHEREALEYAKKTDEADNGLYHGLRRTTDTDRLIALKRSAPSEDRVMDIVTRAIKHNVSREEVTAAWSGDEQFPDIIEMYDYVRANNHLMPPRLSLQDYSVAVALAKDALAIGRPRAEFDEVAKLHPLYDIIMRQFDRLYSRYNDPARADAAALADYEDYINTQIGETQGQHDPAHDSEEFPHCRNHVGVQHREEG